MRWNKALARVAEIEAKIVDHDAVAPQELALVIRRFLKLKVWRDTERIVVGGGFRASRVGELAIARAGVILIGAPRAIGGAPLSCARHSGGEPRLEPAAPFGIDAAADRGRAARSALLLLVLALPLALILVFARLLVFFADRFLRVEAPIRKSSRVAPFLSFPAIHFGMAPRPAQVLAGLSGSRYFGGILPPLRLARVAVLPVISSR